MKSKHIASILIFIFTLISILPTSVGAQQVSGQEAAADICEKTLSAIATMVKPEISSTAIKAGETVIVPLTLKNQTKTPLSDIHLLTKVSRLGKSIDIVSLQYGKDPIALLPGESATTSVVWTTSKSEAAGNYRVDIYPMPTTGFSNPGVLTDVPAPANLNVQVNGKNNYLKLSFDRSRKVVNGLEFGTKYPAYFDVNEIGTMGFFVHNSSAQDIPALINWKVFDGERMDDKDVLFATSSMRLIVRGKTALVEFPVPSTPSSHYFATAEVVGGGRHVLMPISFYRMASLPAPINLFGIVSTRGMDTPFDLRKGNPYSIFVCPSGFATLSPVTLVAEVQDGHGKTIFSQSVVSKVGEVVSPLKINFTSPENIPDGRLVVKSTSNGIASAYTVDISCGNDHDGECAPPPVVPKRDAPRLLLVTVGVLALFLVFLGMYITHKKQHHEENDPH
jgi:hypothetical protein